VRDYLRLMPIMRHVTDLLTRDRDVRGSACTTYPMLGREASDAPPLLVLFLAGPINAVYNPRMVAQVSVVHAISSPTPLSRLRSPDSALPTIASCI